MLRVVTLSAAAVLANVVAAQAGDRPEIYAQFLYGGSLTGLQEAVIQNVALSYNLSSAFAAAGSVGVVVTDGISVELDVFHTSQDLTDLDGYWWTTSSLMAKVKYTLDLNEDVAIYGALGAGMIYGADHYPGIDFHYSGAGFQVTLGGSVDVVDNLAFVGEVRYQDGFEPLQWEKNPTDTRHAPVAAVLVGLKASL